MRNKEKQIEQTADAISKASDFLTYYECDIIAKNLINGWKYTLAPKDSVVLSNEEYESLKRVEKEKDRLYEIKLDLENQLIEKGWTEYEGADAIEERVSKKTAEFWYDKIDTALLAMWKGNCITTEQYNAWVVAFNGFAKQFGVEIKE